ncbi:MAG TPA: hypothetical protein VLL25_14745 [Acidimicrobiales bacterium]|nr:hypothetical protein [Acidimicrobiales bacterium]
MSQADMNAALGNQAEGRATAEPRALGDYAQPIWLQNLSYPAREDRSLLDLLFPVAGVPFEGDMAVRPRALGANMSVDVAPGWVIVAGTDMSYQGKYLCPTGSAIINVPIGPAPAAGLTRRDLIVARVYDAAVIGGTRNDWAIQVIAGTAVSANPQPPTVPASSTVLAEVTVASGTAAVTAVMITDRRRQAGPPPSLHCRVWRNAAYTFTGAVQTLVYDTVERDTHGLYSTATGRFTAPVAGWYRLVAQAMLNAGTNLGATGSINCYRNGVLHTSGMQLTFAVAGAAWPIVSVQAAMYLAVGDYLDARNNSGGGSFNGVANQSVAYANFDYMGPD